MVWGSSRPHVTPSKQCKKCGRPVPSHLEHPTKRILRDTAVWFEYFSCLLWFNRCYQPSPPTARGASFAIASNSKQWGWYCGTVHERSSNSSSKKLSADAPMPIAKGKAQGWGVGSCPGCWCSAAGGGLKKRDSCRCYC
jgi:hypothetical protein